MKPLRYKNLWWACGAAFVALVVYLSLTPIPLEVPSPDEIKLGHFIAYLWLMLWFAQIEPSRGARVVIAAALVFLGIGLEYAQGMTGYRYFAYTDMRDNAIGVAAGFLLGMSPFGNTLRVVEGRFLPRRNSA